MKVLIAIVSCVEYARNGVNQSLRDACLGDIRKPFEYKFFLGDGTPVVESEDFKQSWISRGSRYIDKPDRVASLEGYQAQQDEVILAIPDDYKHISFKTRAMHAYALRNNFDFIFQSYADVYFDFERLRFEQPETFCGNENGGGFWLSREVLNFTANAEVTAWNDDGWVREVLRAHDIELKINSRYGAYPNFPSPDNDFITSHLTISPEIHTAEKMREVSALRRKL
jgi:hypothetical protein